jgi:hypothetical protein
MRYQDEGGACLGEEGCGQFPQSCMSRCYSAVVFRNTVMLKHPTALTSSLVDAAVLPPRYRGLAHTCSRHHCIQIFEPIHPGLVTRLTPRRPSRSLQLRTRSARPMFSLHEECNEYLYFSGSVVYIVCTERVAQAIEGCMRVEFIYSRIFGWPLRTLVERSRR